MIEIEAICNQLSASQLVNNGTTITYDLNGNILSDGSSTNTWGRANRLRSVGTTQYRYDGDSNRISQTVGGTATKYLLGTQPGFVAGNRPPSEYEANWLAHQSEPVLE